MLKFRTEKDSLGEVEVPDEAHWGAQTQRSLQNFPFGEQERMPIPIVHALAILKEAAARVNRRHGLPDKLAEVIDTAAGEVASGKWDDQFPLAIWQTGSGTQTNMNVTEVIASRANQLLTGQRGGKAPVHPNDHVNLSQSSNDSFPTALHVAMARNLTAQLLPALDGLTSELGAKAREWQDIVKLGRTHLQDATPLTLGQEFSGYAAQLADCRAWIAAALDPVMALAQGGTAVGTGLNAPDGFAALIAEEIADLTGLPFRPAGNRFAAIASHDPLVNLSGTLATLAVALTKIANDIRLLGSGPRAGLGELKLPANEPGSSIMPGKVNPTQAEMLTMVSAQVIGNHQAVLAGGMQGHLELNAFKPLIGSAILRSIGLLETGMESFRIRCVSGLEPDRARLQELVDRSLMLVTALVPAIGYDRASQIAHHAEETGTTLRESALSLGLVDDETFDRIVRPEKMIGEP